MIRTLTALVVAFALACTDGTAPSGPPVAIEILSGDTATAVVGTRLPAPIVARLIDADGNAVAGQIVTFHVTAGGGSVFSGSALSTSAGIVQEQWTLGTSSAAAQTVEVRTVNGESGSAVLLGTFHATALPGPPVMLPV